MSYPAAMHFVHEAGVTAGPADPANFTSGVFASVLLAPARDSGLRAARFVYEPGARSHWHTHEGEQAIYVVAGNGLVQRWGQMGSTLVGPGSMVHVEPGEKHWHGAAAGNVFVHLAVTASGGTIWHEPVDEETYLAAQPGMEANGYT